MTRALTITFILFTLFLPLSAQAIRVTTSVGTFDIDTIGPDLFDNNSALLMTQPWWDNQALAGEFRDAVDINFGFPNSEGTEGPYFIYEQFNTGLGSGETSAFCLIDFDSGACIPSDVTTISSGPRVFAIATPAQDLTSVNVPFPIWALLLSSLVLILIGVIKSRLT